MIQVSTALYQINQLLMLLQSQGPDTRAVPVLAITLHTLFILALVSAFIGFYIGVRISRPRYLD